MKPFDEYEPFVIAEKFLQSVRKGREIRASGRRLPKKFLDAHRKKLELYNAAMLIGFDEFPELALAIQGRIDGEDGPKLVLKLEEATR